jgi:hypothetical protein
LALLVVAGAGWLLLRRGAADAPAKDAVAGSRPRPQLDLSGLRPERPKSPVANVDAAPLEVVLESLEGGGARALSWLSDPELARLIESGRRGERVNFAEKAAQHNWEIGFPRGQTSETYARQLDYFRIELAVLRPAGELLYVSNLSDETPVQRTGAVNEERRYYLTWRGGALASADVEALARAGIQAENCVILKLLPPDLEDKLAGLERAKAGDKAERVRKTRFEIRSEGAAGFAFHAVEQWYY